MSGEIAGYMPKKYQKMKMSERLEQVKRVAIQLGGVTSMELAIALDISREYARNSLIPMARVKFPYLQYDKDLDLLYTPSKEKEAKAKAQKEKGDKKP